MGPARGKRHSIAKEPNSPALRRAAQYVRMSAEQQRYSIENQMAVIAAYALCHDMKIVKTYADEGRSGLTMKGRDALKQLIEDAQAGKADFEVILVYDVSRWGRFQNPDESAYYEFICKAAGFPVIYCAEPFENDGSILATLIKVLKRTMASEYSRELSAKVSRAHKRHAEQGFHQGGSPNYGLRRVLVDANGLPKKTLRDGEGKSLFSDRVILGRGPDSETNIVREIFHLFVVDRMHHKQIARHLNKKGLRNRLGNPWSDSNILQTLSSEKYAGTFVYHRTSLLLGGSRIFHNQDEWVRVEGVIDPIIDRATFDTAQRLLLGERWRLTDNELLGYLTAAWCTWGYLSCPRINLDRVCPAVNTYRKRFGSMTNAYKMVGYKAVPVYRYFKIGNHIQGMHRDVICRLTSEADVPGRKILYNEVTQTLQIADSVSVAVVIVPYLFPKLPANRGWKLYLGRLPICGAILLIRLNKLNSRFLDYHLIPRGAFSCGTFRFTDDTIKQFKPYRLRSLATFYRDSQKIALLGH